MQALILAGGVGSRLRPVTDYLPKPMIAVGGRTIIERQISYLKGHDIDEVVVCSGYLTDQIEHLLNTRDLGVTVRVSKEAGRLGTAGAIKNAGPLIRGDSFVVLNGDVITDIDVTRLYQKPDSIAVIELRSRFGVVDTDGDAITGFDEKGTVGGIWMNAGVYHLSSGILDDLPAKGDIERTTFADYAGLGRLSAVRFGGIMWHSIDSFKDIAECENSLRSRSGAA